MRTTVFRNNRTQAVRLPKPVALPDDIRTVEVHAVGDARIITPVGGDWAFWFEHGPRVSDDFLSSRDQPDSQSRESL